MKTYKKTVEKPRLIITHDEEGNESPREWSNLGYFITVERRSQSPDRHLSLEAIVKRTGDEAESVENHMEMIKTACVALGEKVVHIVPVTKFDHGNVIYQRGYVTGFDYSNNGFYIVTEKTLKDSGHAFTDEASLNEIIDAEIETYNQWVNNEVYSFTLYDEEGEIVDSCGGFYVIEDIREHLPSEWKDEKLEDYLVS